MLAEGAAASGTAGCGEAAPSGTAEDTSARNAVEKDDNDEWGKFYSMPPKWTSHERDNSPSKHEGGKLTDENIGHKLASLLRYHLGENSINQDENGWVVAANIIAHADAVGLGGVTEEDIIRVAEGNEHSTRGKRFDSDGAGRIKAMYKHPPKDRRSTFDRDVRYSRGTRSRGYNDGWWSNGWYDNDKWGKDGQDQGDDDTWSQWRKPGFSPSPDDTIVKSEVKASSWKEPGQADAAENIATDLDAVCEWEQWFTPEADMYYYSIKTEEYFFPGDAADCEEKGWARYVDTEGDKEGKIYWWHEASNRSFYEEDVSGVGDTEK